MLGIGGGRSLGYGLNRAGGGAGNGLLNNLVAYWPLNEAAGANDALDLHTNGLTLTQVSSPGSAAGIVYAGARTFDGAADYFTRDSAALLNVGAGDWALAAWIKTSSATGNKSIVDKRGSATGATLYRGFLLIVVGDKPRVGSDPDENDGSRATAITSTHGVSDGNWHHVAAWRSGTTLGLQVDAYAAETATIVYITTVDNGAPWRVGYKSTSGASTITYFNGSLGPIAFWKSSGLSAAQRSQLYAGGAGLAYANFTT